MGASLQETAAVVVCPVRKAKAATRTTKLTTAKGNFAKTTEIQKPLSDEEDEERPQQKKKKPSKPEEDIDDDKVTAVVSQNESGDKFEEQ